MPYFIFILDLAREFALRGADSMIAAESELNMESDDSF